MEPFTTLTSRTVVLARSNIDTDQIIPARFLTTTTKAGLGVHLFADWRYDSEGGPRADFVLNQASAAGCRVLAAGRNFADPADSLVVVAARGSQATLALDALVGGIGNGALVGWIVAP